MQVTKKKLKRLDEYVKIFRTFQNEYIPYTNNRIELLNLMNRNLSLPFNLMHQSI